MHTYYGNFTGKIMLNSSLYRFTYNVSSHNLQLPYIYILVINQMLVTCEPRAYQWQASVV